MSFLAPLFLLGALAVALPIVLHLARRTARQRTVFSSLLFLRPAPPRLTRRNRIEHRLLLLLRCLVIGLLAFGFARPFFRRNVSETPPAATPQRVVLLLDASASMRRGSLWTQAQDRADRWLRQISPRDQVAVCAFDRDITPLVTFEQWSALPAGDRAAFARSRLTGIAPGWASTALDHALIRAAEWLAGLDEQPAPGLRRRIVLISDLQAGSRLNGLQGYEWPREIDLSIEALDPPATSNASLQLAPEPADAPATPGESTVRIRVHNAPDAQREQIEIAWANASGTRIGTNLALYVPAGQSRVVSLPTPPPSAGADRIVLRGDDEEFDNTLYAAPPEPARVTVLYLGKDDPADPSQPRYFLERAFRETRRQTVQVVVPASPGTEARADTASLVVVTDAPDEAQQEAVRTHLARGMTVLFAPPDPAAVSALARLPGLDGLSAEEGRFANYGLWGEIDFRHPLFAPFADPRFSDFTRIHFWKYRRLDASAIAETRALARFDNGDPALLEIPAGRGRVLALASGWRPADSQLALSTKFVPLLYSILESSGAAQPVPVSYVVGDRVRLSRDPARTGAAVTVTRHDRTGTRVAGTADEFADTLVPGHYTTDPVTDPGRFAVNLDPAESRTTLLPADELERLGAPVARPPARAIEVAARAARLRDAEIEGRQKLWRWIIVATLAILGVETWLAGWTMRRDLTPSEALQ